MTDKQAKHLVAVDLGSNSFHMVVAREQAGCIQVVHTQKERVKLAAGLDKNGHLSEAAIARGVACLQSFSRHFFLDPAQSVRVVATYTLRKAINTDEFITKAKEVFPYEIEVISGEDEAKLIYQGVANTYPIRGHTMVIDIGGGSTEFILGADFDCKKVESLEVGSGVLSKSCFADGVVSDAKMIEAKAQVAANLSPYVEEYKDLGWQKAVGTSGSIKVIAQAMNELFGDKDITLERLETLAQRFIDNGHYNEVKLATVDKQRLAQLPGAVAILLVAFEQLGIEHMEYCSSALREGVLYGLSESCQDFDPRHRTINNLATLHGVDYDYARRVKLQLQHGFEVLSSRGWILTPKEQMYLTRAALLHEIGLSINFKKRQVHGAYIIQHSLMPGFNASEHLVIQYLVRNHRGRIVADFEGTYIPAARMMGMIQLLRLAVILTRGRMPASVHEIDLYFEPPALVLELTDTELNDSAMMNALETEVQAQAKAGLQLVLR